MPLSRVEPRMNSSLNREDSSAVICCYRFLQTAGDMLIGVSYGNDRQYKRRD